jgi:hypothetical protein
LPTCYEYNSSTINQITTEQLKQLPTVWPTENSNRQAVPDSD